MLIPSRNPFDSCKFGWFGGRLDFFERIRRVYGLERVMDSHSWDGLMAYCSDGFYFTVLVQKWMYLAYSIPGDGSLKSPGVEMIPSPRGIERNLVLLVISWYFLSFWAWCPRQLRDPPPRGGGYLTFIPVCAVHPVSLLPTLVYELALSAPSPAAFSLRIFKVVVWPSRDSIANLIFILLIIRPVLLPTQSYKSK